MVRPCPRCGAANDVAAPYCYHCGQPFRRGQTGWDVLAIVLFVIVGIPAALVASCAAMLSVGSISRGSAAPVLITGLLAAAVFVALLWLAFLRKR